jgi:HlyD family secretion protein
LAELDTDKLNATADSSRAKLVAAKAKVADAEATVAEKERDLARKKTLEEKHYTSTQDLDLAQASYDRAVAALASAQADVGVAEADLRLKETDLAKACICSPINGVVLERNVDPGQFVATSLQAPVLFTIAEDLKQMELQVDVDEADVGKIKIGQEASFSVDAFPDRKFPATIRDVRFASEIIQGVVTYKAVLDIDNSELLLRPGMTATAEIKATEIADALLVPNAALRFTPPVSDTTEDQSFIRRIIPGPPRFRPASKREDTGSNRTVWVLRDDDPTPVEVVIGLSDGKRTEVRSGEIQVGEALIVDQTTSKP